MDAESLSVLINRQGNGELYRIKIAIERTDDGDDPEPPLDLTQIRILQDPILCYPLTKVSSRRWEMTGFIVLFDAARAVDCVVKSGDGEDISSLHLEGDAMHAEDPGHEYTHCRDIEACNTRVHLIIRGTFNVLPQNGPGREAEALEFVTAASDVVTAFEQLPLFETPAGFTERTNKLRRAVELACSSSDLLLYLLQLLALSLKDRGKATGSLPDTDEAISLQGTVVNLLPEFHKERPCELSKLGHCFLARFTHTDAPQDFSNALLMARTAVQGDPQSDISLEILGDCSYESFTRTGHLADFDEAISMLQRSIGLTEIGHPELPRRLRTIVHRAAHRFVFTKLPIHADEALSIVQRAIEATPVGCADLPHFLSQMGKILMGRFERSGCLSDRDESVKAHRRAAELTQSGHPSFLFAPLYLARSLHTSSNYTGNQLELEEGILLLQRAIAETPGEDPHLSLCHAELGTMLRSRFNFTNNILDATEDVAKSRRAVEAYREGDEITFQSLLHRHIMSLSSLSQISGHPVHLQEAITTARNAMNLLSHHHRLLLLPINLQCLSGLLWERWQATREPSDLDESVSVLEKAIELSTRIDPSLPDRLRELGTLFRARYEVAHDALDLAKAISNLEQAIQLTPPGCASLQHYYWCLGVARYTRFKETAGLIRNTGSNHSVPAQTLMQCEEDEKGWRTAFKLAATFPIGDPNRRLRAAVMWARCTAVWLLDSPDILLALDTALGLLAMKAGLDQTIRTRHIQLQGDALGVTATATEAAFIALMIHRPDKALEWLEQGRCLVWTQINHLRTPLDNLHTHNPSLAETLMEVSKRLEMAGSSPQEHPCIDMSPRRKVSLQEEAYAHANIAKQWGGLLCQVRAIPGFESFLQPAKCHALLQSIPNTGLIVIINVSSFQCDAIVMVEGVRIPYPIPLPNFSEDKAKQHQRDLGLELKSRGLRLRKGDPGADEEHPTRTGGHYRQRRGTPIRRVLRGLWTDVVRPIIEVLAISRFEDDGKDPLRVWWCPTGTLSFLPLHAAGIYGPGMESESVLDYFISSYTPTVSALAECVRKDRRIDESISGLFLTSQPDAPGLSKIAGTTTEVRSIYKRAVDNGIRALKVEGDDLAVNDCLDHLEEFSSVHLACHGYQNLEESLQSKFRFHNGSLDLGTILRKDLKNADLAFLSACETSTGDVKLSDEAVHLASGMLAAGYRRVVGTMWCIGDKTAQEVSTSFYDWLFDHRDPGSGSRFDGTLSAYALHHSIQKLRDDLGDTDDAILAWAPFVHWGY
ncbi:hypothetical protein FA13DRAFT_1734139 [Coprinellus micaceus]|uniref:CHAT domain-containing protein n=1 Tax=Coprinellus micaceus TaxID=71717 RepID=A0A4Y7T770_COPMI|nr:hypothetical protein FA13DRAFT_1734139 [Coprinellus micaceus]